MLVGLSMGKSPIKLILGDTLKIVRARAGRRLTLRYRDFLPLSRGSEREWCGARNRTPGLGPIPLSRRY